MSKLVTLFASLLLAVGLSQSALADCVDGVCEGTTLQATDTYYATWVWDNREDPSHWMDASEIDGCYAAWSFNTDDPFGGGWHWFWVATANLGAFQIKWEGYEGELIPAKPVLVKTTCYVCPAGESCQWTGSSPIYKNYTRANHDPTRDCYMGGEDYNQLLSYWQNTCAELEEPDKSECEQTDLDGDGVVGAADLSAIQNLWQHKLCTDHTWAPLPWACTGLEFVGWVGVITASPPVPTTTVPATCE